MWCGGVWGGVAEGRQHRAGPGPEKSIRLFTRQSWDRGGGRWGEMMEGWGPSHRCSASSFFSSATATCNHLLPPIIQLMPLNTQQRYSVLSMEGGRWVAGGGGVFDHGSCSYYMEYCNRMGSKPLKLEEREMVQVGEIKSTWEVEPHCAKLSFTKLETRSEGSNRSS